MKNTRSMIIAAALVLVASGAVWAQGEGGMKQRGGGGKDKIIKELNLTAEQEKKFEANRKAQQEQMIALREAIKAKQAQLQGALNNPAVTRAQVEPFANEIKALHAKIVDHRLDGIFAVKEILTPEQFAKMQAIMKEHKKDKGERFGGRQKLGGRGCR